MYATVSSKGQVAIPVAIRNKLGLGVGDRIDFVLFGQDRVELIPRRRSVTALKGIVRHVGKPVSLEEMEEAISCGGGE